VLQQTSKTAKANSTLVTACIELHYLCTHACDVPSVVDLSFSFTHYY